MKKKLLIINNFLNQKSIGGYENLLKNFIENYQDKYQITLLISKDSNYKNKKVKILKNFFNFWNLEKTRNFYQNFKYLILKNYYEIKNIKTINQTITNFDNIIVFNPVGILSNPFKLLNKFKKKIIYVVGDPWLYHIFNKSKILKIVSSLRYFSYIFKKNISTNFFLFNRKFNLNRCSKFIKGTGKMYNLNTDIVFKEKKFFKKKNFILWANRITSNCNIEESIKCFESINYKLKNYKLIIIGNIIDNDKYKKLKLTISRKRNIKFIKFNLRKFHYYMNVSKIYLNNSKEGDENIYTILNCVYYNTIPLVNERPGTTEIISHKSNGYLLSRNSSSNHLIQFLINKMNKLNYNEKNQKRKKNKDPNNFNLISKVLEK